MRHALLAACLAFLVLAGCLQPGSAPTTSTPATSTPASSTPPGIAVGEPAPAGRPTGAMAVRPAEETNRSAGFTLYGNETRSLILAGQEVTFTFVATNDGDNATVVYDPCNGGNPGIEIRDANGTALTLDEPGMRCMVATSLQPFPTNASVNNTLTWDGKAWDGQQRSPVAPGSYTAHATFAARRGDTPVSITLDVPVGVTDQRGTL